MVESVKHWDVEGRVSRGFSPVIVGHELEAYTVKRLGLAFSVVRAVYRVLHSINRGLTADR